jgi:penicillin amidase
VGATLPGVPGVVVGRTPTVAWGLTNAMLDDGDLWSEEVDGTGTRYRVDGAWRDLMVETQEIRRRGRAPVLFRLRRTHRGPLITDALPGATGAPLSLRLVLHESADEMRCFLRLGRARTADDLERAAEGYGAPAQNVIWATVDGEAGYRFFGRVPVRPPAEAPILPRDGTTTASDWTGWVPSADLPAFRVPRDGVVVTANDAHAGPEFPHYLSCLYEPGYRAERIRSLLRGRSGLTPDDLARVQMDAYSLAIDAFRRQVVLPCADAIRSSRPPAVPLLDRLLATTGSEAVDAAGPALLHFTYYHLARRVFGLHLEDDLVHRWMACVNLMDAPLLAAFSDPDSPWCRPAVRPTLLGEAMEAAAKDLAARGLPIDAAWGDVHRLVLRHPLSAVPVLGDAFTQGPFPMPGGPYTPLSGQYLHDRPAAMVVGASYRHVVDMADPEGSARMILFGGQSGHVGSPHYGDLTARWRAVAFLPMRLERFPERGRDLRLLP